MCYCTPCKRTPCCHSCPLDKQAEWALMADNINHPSHYNNSKAKCECGKQIECINVTRHMSSNIGSAMKYLWQYAHKNGIEDLKKARWYLDDAIKQLENNS